MILRKLHTDQSVVTLGVALTYITPDVKVLAQTPTLMCLYNEDKKEWMSFAGTEDEMKVLNTMYSVGGPTIEFSLLRAVPVQYKALRERRSNAASRKEAIAYAISTSFPGLDVLELSDRGFNAWVRAFDPYVSK